MFKYYLLVVLFMPTTIQTLKMHIIRTEYQIEAEERAIKSSLSRIKKLEKHIINCQTKLENQEKEGWLN